MSHSREKSKKMSSWTIGLLMTISGAAAAILFGCICWIQVSGQLVSVDEAGNMMGVGSCIILTLACLTVSICGILKLRARRKKRRSRHSHKS